MGTLLENCKPNFKAQAIGKIETNSIAYFYKIRDVNRCNIYGFKNSTATGANILYSYANADKPDEKICGLDKCDMTGTLFVTPDTGEGALPSVVTTEIKANGEDFQYGYLRVLIYGTVGDIYDLTVSNMTGTGANKYNVTLTEDGFNSVLLELFNPDELVDGGWIAGNESIKLTVEARQATPYRLSTAELFSEVHDLVQDQTIGFQCITDFSGDPALTMTEDLCEIPVYDETATVIERSLTASKIIGDLVEFSNITRRQKASEHLYQTRDEFTAVSETLDGEEYAVFTIPELAEIKCPRLLVQPQDCDFESLKHLNIDNDINQFDITDEFFFRKGNKIYLSSAYKGMKIMAAYPIWVEGTGYDITSDDLNKQRYQMDMKTPIGRDEWIIKADNVMLSGLPMTWTNAAGTFTVTYTMAKDSYGKFGEMVKVDKRK